MRIIEISGPISDGMWHLRDPMPPVEVRPLPSPPWVAYTVYSHHLSLCVQAGTYLETAAHMYPNMRTIDQLSANECVMDAVVVHVPRGPVQPIGSADLIAALDRAGTALQPGDALLVATGWDVEWNSPRFLSEPPYFAAETIDWLLEQKIGLLGADTPSYDSPVQPQNFFARFFAADVLLLAPAVQLTTAQPGRWCLIALPLKITGACASPTRALLVDGLQAAQFSASPSR